MGAYAYAAKIAAATLALAGAAASQTTPPEPATLDSAESILAAQPLTVRRELEHRGLVMLPATAPDGRVYALVRFEQPRRRVIRLLSQTARHHEFRPELREIESLGWSENGSLETHRMRIMFMNIDYRLRNHFDWNSSRIWWELDPDFDNGLEVVEGFWQLYEVDGRSTLGHFGTQVNVGSSLPSWLQEAVTRKNVPEAMHNVKHWVDSDGTYRP